MPVEDQKSEKDNAEEPEKDAGEGTHKENNDPTTLEAALSALADMRDALKRVNAESADRRKRLKALEDAAAAQREKDEKAARAKLDEVERLKAELADRDKALAAAAAAQRETVIAAALEREATKLNFADLADVLAAYKLGQLEGIEFDDGKVTGVEPALKALAKAKPHWVKKTTEGTRDSIDAGRNGRNGAGLLSVEEIVARKRREGGY